LNRKCAGAYPRHDRYVEVFERVFYNQNLRRNGGGRVFHHFDRETAKNIETVLNGMMGMSHRTKPYDLNSAEDMSQLFLLSTAAYMDYQRYWLALSNIDEEMDESLEHYDPATWLNMTVAPEKTDELAMEAISSLSETVNLFSRLMDRAKEQCVLVIGALLSAPASIQNAVLGRAYAIPEDERDERIEALFEGLDDVEPHYNMEKNRDEFLAVIEKTWGGK
jgi:hypothetical protein